MRSCLRPASRCRFKRQACFYWDARDLSSRVSYAESIRHFGSYASIRGERSAFLPLHDYHKLELYRSSHAPCLTTRSKRLGKMISLPRLQDSAKAHIWPVQGHQRLTQLRWRSHKLGSKRGACQCAVPLALAAGSMVRLNSVGYARAVAYAFAGARARAERGGRARPDTVDSRC